MNYPLILTWSRIAAIPLVVLTHYLGMPFTAAFIFGIAGLTDLLDGYLARKYNLTSRFGAFLDPVADKLLVIMGVILVVEREGSLLITLAGLIIISREIIISSLREWMAEIGQRDTVQVAMIGKVKSVSQIIALIFLLYNQDLFGFIPIREPGLIGLAIATILAVWSMVFYLKQVFANGKPSS